MKKILIGLLWLIVPALLAQTTISNVYVQSSTATTATIVWTTSTVSTSQIRYGYNNTLPYSNNTDYTKVTSHSMTLTLLNASQPYYFATVSVDAGGHLTQSSTIQFALCGQPQVPVSGTVNQFYYNGTYSITWNPPSGSSGTPTICSQPLTTTVSGSLNLSGSFSAQVADALKVTPGPGTWTVAVADTGNLSPIRVTLPLSATTQDISSQLQAAAATTSLVGVIANNTAQTVYPSWLNPVGNYCPLSGCTMTGTLTAAGVTSSSFTVPGAPAGYFISANGSGAGAALTIQPLSQGKQNPSRPQIPIMPHDWAFFKGAAPAAPAGANTWPNNLGSLTVTGTAGNGSLTINSINVGVIADYEGAAGCTRTGCDWATIIQCGTGTKSIFYGPYTVSSASVIAGAGSSLTIYPTPSANLSSCNLVNVHDNVLGQHLTGWPGTGLPEQGGYGAMAAWATTLHKYDGYIAQVAGGRYFDGGGNAYGTALVPCGGWSSGGYVPGTSSTIVQTMTEGGSVQLNNTETGTSASTDPNATWAEGLPGRITITAGTAGNCWTQTVNLNGQSGRFNALIGVGGQYLTTPPSQLTVTVTVDGKTIYSNNTLAGLQYISAPFVNGHTGILSITLNSSAPTEFGVSDLMWPVWTPDLDSIMLAPLIPPGSNVFVNFDSWGSQHSSAFPTALFAYLNANTAGALTSTVNTSVSGQTVGWADGNLCTGVNYLPIPCQLFPDYGLHDQAINDQSSTDRHIVWATVTAGGSYLTPPSVIFNNCNGINPIAQAVLAVGTLPQPVSYLAFSQVGVCTTIPTASFSSGSAAVTLQMSGYIAPAAITSVDNASSGSTVYHGSFPSCGSNACSGHYFFIAGLDIAANNSGVTGFLCTASSTGTLTLSNANGASDVHAGTAAYNDLVNNVNTLMTDDLSYGITPLYFRSPMTASMGQTFNLAFEWQQMNAGITIITPASGLANMNDNGGTATAGYPCVSTSTLHTYNCASATLPVAAVPTTVLRWYTPSALFIPNGTNGCVTAAGCIQVTKIDGSVQVIATTHTSTQGFYLTLTNITNMWLSNYRIVPTVQCTNSDGLSVFQLTDASGSAAVYGSPGFSLTGSVTNTNIYNGNPATTGVGGKTIAGSGVFVTLQSPGGFIDETSAGCAFNMPLYLGTTQ